MIGEKVGNYRIVRALGEGGMGRVYLAEHPELGRRAAVKVLRPDLARSPEMLRRFFNEARAANAIGHPGIVETFDCGTLESGSHYLVMELLEGESLAARLARLGRRPTGEAVDLAVQTASALEAAHAKGIVHRDLKPEHIFLVADPRRPGADRVKVLDFGIAKLMEPEQGVSHTRTGTIMGTPRYMSPEQCRATREVDHRTDVYALGVILYEMLAGAPPFSSDSWGELVHMHIGVAPPGLRSRNPEVSGALDAVVQRALAKDPDQRFQSMAELREVLLEAAKVPPGGEVAAVPTVRLAPAQPAVESTTLAASASELARATSERRRSRLLASGLVVGAFTVAMTVTILAGSLRSRRPPPPPHPAAVQTATAPPPITVSIVTIPEGGRVVRARDGATLGATPFRTSWPRGEGIEELRVERDGFQSERLFVALDRDQALRMELRPVPPPARATPVPRRPAAEARPARPAPKRREPLKI